MMESRIGGTWWRSRQTRASLSESGHVVRVKARLHVGELAEVDLRR